MPKLKGIIPPKTSPRASTICAICNKPLHHNEKAAKLMWPAHPECLPHEFEHMGNHYSMKLDAMGWPDFFVSSNGNKRKITRMAFALAYVSVYNHQHRNAPLGTIGATFSPDDTGPDALIPWMEAQVHQDPHTDK